MRGQRLRVGRAQLARVLALDQPLGERSRHRSGWAWAAAVLLACAAALATFYVAASPATRAVLDAGSLSGTHVLGAPDAGD